MKNLQEVSNTYDMILELIEHYENNRNIDKEILFHSLLDVINNYFACRRFEDKNLFMSGVNGNNAYGTILLTACESLEGKSFI